MAKVLFLTQKQFKRRFPRAKRGVVTCTGPRPAFRNPVQFQIRHPEWTLCQGFSKTSPTGFFAWVERGSCCLDLSNVSDSIYFSVIVGKALSQKVEEFVTENQIPRREFYRQRGISGVRKYAKEQTRAQLNKNGTYGPWKEYA
jgi:hypothetical protein